MNPAPEVHPLRRNGWVPNNEQWPLLIYRQAVDPSGGPSAAAERLESLISQHAWNPHWRDGVYSFHHYHSTAHEVLGIAAGSAQLIFGGENGLEITVNAGDIAVLPAGTGHCKQAATSDFLVVGGFPAGQDWDTCRAAPDTQMEARLRLVHYPCDPVTGGPPVKA